MIYIIATDNTCIVCSKYDIIHEKIRRRYRIKPMCCFSLFSYLKKEKAHHLAYVSAYGTSITPSIIRLRMKLRILLCTFMVFLFVKKNLVASDSDYKLTNNNVLIITIDSLRADHLSCYGYKRDTTPNIDMMAKSGALFTTAISQAPWTKPSVASLFTSSYMTIHNVWYSYKETRDYAISCKMSNDMVTLAEILKIHGYETAAFGQKFHLRQEFGFKQGFGSFNMRLGRSLNITNNVLSWLQEKQPNKFFIYIHYDDAHFPYNPPDKFKMYDIYKSTANITGENIQTIRRGTLKLSEEDVNHVIASYDGEIKCVDEKINILMNKLHDMGYGDNTIVVILADHGDEFMEHGGVAHGHSLYGELTHIPLIIKSSTIPGNIRVDGLAQSIDIAPTILDFLDLQPDKEWEGKSLVPLIFKGEAVHDYVYSEHKGYNSKDFLRSIQSTKWKLIRNYYKKQSLLFDLENDPGEFVNVKDRYPKIAAKLESQLSKWLKKERSKSNTSQFMSAIKIDEATKERLKSLGYAN